MVKWYFQNYFLENKELLFYVGVGIILLIIIITIYLVCKELKNDNSWVS
jgi:hypothetical protein